MTAHELARKLLSMPDVPVRYNVHGTCESWTEEVMEATFDKISQQVIVE